MRNLAAIGSVCLLAFTVIAGEGDFADVKRELARSGCHTFQFLSIVESDVFDVVDTASGMAYIASDGRYYIEVADEIYLFDLDYSYTYSESSGQVVIERETDATDVGEEFSFILRLDELYETKPTGDRKTFQLFKRTGVSDSYPDSMVVLVDLKHSRLSQLEFYDINEELNRIVIQTQTFQPECDTTRFLPDFPETAEVIKL